ncbi:hypothetical protein EV644_102243 [Kribbella orskensis]|uniref:Uncharacterized protein n=1 Tax=Kribbella orskensis TaxID=2512216 RepID=A0ABY2BSD1_9ACTN|nr:MULTISPECIES: hypothetical protein [Kribbella]TCN43120.1 hypothetical protein EV642_102494 [Kribbella sp. VKM Ac-2500]TCO29524.1 hypothetical protein EV644_102243 [Kribbella orskensis]
MKKYLAWPVALATLGLTAMSVVPAEAAPVPVTSVQTQAAASTAEEPGSLLEQARAMLGPEIVATATATAQRLGLEEAPASTAAILKAIDPEDYACSPNTPLTDWVAGTITDWTLLDRIFALGATLSNLTGYGSMIATPANSPYGLNGEFTTAVTHTFRDVKTFWDIQSADIRIKPMHSAVLADRTALYQVFRTIYNRSDFDSTYFANLYASWAEQPKFRNHPLLSMNAYAFTGVGDPNPALAALPDQIVMGDGIMQAYQAIGLGDVAPQAILSHEFGHHVQYEDGLFASDLTGPEATRRTELMADGFGAYFLSHSRGASMQWKRVRLFDQVFYGIGDCNFSDAGHHGTPNQRLRTVEWAYSVVTGAPDQGHILPSLAFAGLFDAKLPALVAPDAGS